MFVLFHFKIINPQRERGSTDIFFTLLFQNIYYPYNLYFVTGIEFLFIRTKTFGKRPSQLTFTCSKSTTKTLKKLWNMFKVNNKNTRTTPLTSFSCFYCWLWTYFTPFSSVSVVDFKQVNVIWDTRPSQCCKFANFQEVQIKINKNKNKFS